jgi:hypothetical protein
VKRTASFIAPGLLLVLLAGCSASDAEKPPAPRASPTSQKAEQEVEPETQDREEAPAEPLTTATVADGYPQEWIDLNIPKVDGLTVGATYLPDSRQIRVIGDSIASDEVIAAFGHELADFGWTENTPGEEWGKETEDTRYYITIATELDQFTTITVWEFEIRK